MNPLNILDYIYYRIAYFYAYRFNYEQSKELAGITGLTFILTVNIFTILNLFGLKSTIQGKQYVLFFIGANVVMFILNYIRYLRLHKYDILETKWSNEGEIKKLVKGLLIFMYFLLSIFLFIKF